MASAPTRLQATSQISDQEDGAGPPSPASSLGLHCRTSGSSFGTGRYWEQEHHALVVGWAVMISVITTNLDA